MYIEIAVYKVIIGLNLFYLQPTGAYILLLKVLT